MIPIPAQQGPGLLVSIQGLPGLSCGDQVPGVINFTSFTATSDFLLWDLEPGFLPSMR